MQGFKFRLFFIFMLVVFSSQFSSAQKKRKLDKDTEKWRYEIECAGVGVQGTYLVKVWTYSESPKLAIEQAKKNAVHAIIFRGFSGGTGRCPSQLPLSRNPNLEKEKEGFFKDFFSDGGKYRKFATVSNDGAINAGDIQKLSKNEYKIGVVVSVQKDALRKDLEDAGILKKLGI